MATTNNFTFGVDAHPFTLNFPFIDEDNLVVTLDGVVKTLDTDYTVINKTSNTAAGVGFLSGAQIQFTASPLPTTGAVKVVRNTTLETTSTFKTGSAIRAIDLNSNFTQNLYVTEEISNNAILTDGSNAFDGDLNMGGNQITNLGTPATDSDAVTKLYVDSRVGSSSIPGYTRWRTTATASQTVFSGVGESGGTLAYSATRENVYVNGALQQRTVDYTADNGTTITFIVGLQAGDIVDVICVNNVSTVTSDQSSELYFLQSGTGATTRTVESKLRDVISVKDFIPAGTDTATTDCSSYIQAAIDYFRTKVESVTGQSGCIALDFGGGVYRVTSSINLTGIQTWGWAVENGTLLGECTGKAVLDMSASRGGRLSYFVVNGSETSKPRVGIQSCRSAAGGQDGFCDNMFFEKVSVVGYFSLSAVYFYAQESTTHLKCQYWNYDENGYAGIHVGYDFVPYQSDYITPVTGDRSYINDKYINVDWRYLPAGKSKGITGITRSNPAVVTAPSHPFSNGDTVVITQVQGMTQINNVKAVVTNATTDTFQLTGVNSTPYGTYTTGGIVVKSQTKPTVLFGRGSQHSFDNCYTVNYGTDSIEYQFSSFNDNVEITFDFLFEGAGSSSHVSFVTNVGTVSPKLYDFVFKTYNTHCRDSIFKTDTGVGETISFYGGSIDVTNFSFSNPTLLDTPTEYAFYNCDVLYPSRANFDPAATITYSGSYVTVDDGVAQEWNKTFKSDDDATWTPVLSTSVGTITSYTGSAEIRRIGTDLVFVTIHIDIVDNGTGAGNMEITNLPIAHAASNRRSTLCGRENGVSGKMLQGFIGPGSTSIAVKNFDGSYPSATNAQIDLSGVYYVGT